MSFTEKCRKLLSRRWIRIGCVLLTGFLIFKAIHLWDSRGQGFRLYKIQSKPPYDERWDIAYTEEDLKTARDALSQPYHFLAHGFQVYAFISEDGKYILKFFRHQRLRLPNFVMRFPSFPLFDEWRKSRILSLARRQDYLFRSCKTSWDIARHETELLMVHLNTTNGIYPKVSIHDLLGNTYSIELDKYQFLLQRRAFLVKPTLTNFMKQGKIKDAEKCIDRIFALFLDCAKKGIVDTDGALIRKDNLGFFEDRAIYIDGGKLAPRQRPTSKKDFLRDIKRLQPLFKWLQQEHPALVKYFEKARANAIKLVEKESGQSVPEARESEEAEVCSK